MVLTYIMMPEVTGIELLDFILKPYHRSDESRFATDSELVIDGGYTAQ
jgi:hypothetical protein